LAPPPPGTGGPGNFDGAGDGEEDGILTPPGGPGNFTPPTWGGPVGNGILAPPGGPGNLDAAGVGVGVGVGVDGDMPGGPGNFGEPAAAGLGPAGNGALTVPGGPGNFGFDGGAPKPGIGTLAGLALAPAPGCVGVGTGAEDFGGPPPMVGGAKPPIPGIFMAPTGMRGLVGGDVVPAPGPVTELAAAPAVGGMPTGGTARDGGGVPPPGSGGCWC
jgi:hypothetical protein